MTGTSSKKDCLDVVKGVLGKGGLWLAKEWKLS